MPPTGDFKAQLGRPENPGLLNQEARLALIQPGRNPYVTGTALPGNSPVFFWARANPARSSVGAAPPGQTGLRELAGRTAYR